MTEFHHFTGLQAPEFQCPLKALPCNQMFGVFRALALVCFLVSGACMVGSISAQELVSLNVSKGIIKSGPSEGQSLVPAPVFPSSVAERSAAFVVNYTGFTPEAEAAFQYAVDIWSALLTADVTIEIDAVWQDLPGNTLGSAGANGYYTLNGSGLPLDGGIYPVALANHFVGYDINDGAPEINANFDSGTSWYLGTDGNAPSNQFDFVSVVLHEIGHGLGFAGSATYAEDGTGSFLAGSTLFAFDSFVELGDATPVGSLANAPVELGAALVSDDLFWNGAGALAASSGSVKMYAPGAWTPGSSYSHFDESTYGQGDPASLMTPQIGFGEVIHDPGAMALGLLSDIGWTAGYPENTSGCTYANACNYSASAIQDNGSCVFVSGCEVCQGGQAVLADADEDGICDSDEVDGCTDSNYQEFNPLASNDDGSCVTLSVLGCTYSDANNFDSGANEDNGTCVFNLSGANSDCPDLDNNGVIGVDDILTVLAVFGDECTVN